MNRIVLSLIFLCILPVTLFAQIDSDGNIEPTKTDLKNNFQFELLGKGLFYSLSYERELVSFDEITVNFSSGFCIFPSFTSLEPSNEIILPAQLNVGYSINSHHLHFGFGTSFWRYSTNYLPIDNNNISSQPISPILKEQWEVFSHLTFEYRYNNKEKKLLYKIGYVPLFFAEMPNTAFNKKVNYQTSLCLGIGYKF